MGIQVSDSTLASLVLKQITEPDPHVLLFEYTETTEDAVFVLVKGEEVSSYEVLVPAPIFALRSREIREIVEHFNPAAVTYRITDASFVFSGNGATGTGYNPAGPLYSGGFTQSAASLPPTPDLDT
jgi:hypothetical protein